ncbi:GNAT family N-acetyltransferase [bacterium]|nr:GNAT family N-acetyltransferase [bacterium]
MIRDATPEDHDAWLELWQGFLDFYEEDLDPAITDFAWNRLMDPASPMQMRLAVVEGVPLGFAIHQHHPSTWVMGDDCYLEDLFVDPKARGRGLGRALIEDLMAIARAKGWHRLYWHTHHDNATARRLYDSIVPADGNIRYRLYLNR